MQVLILTVTGTGKKRKCRENNLKRERNFFYKKYPSIVKSIDRR